MPSSLLRAQPPPDFQTSRQPWVGPTYSAGNIFFGSVANTGQIINNPVRFIPTSFLTHDDLLSIDQLVNNLPTFLEIKK